MANLIADRELLETAFSDAPLVLHSKDPVATELVRSTFFVIEETNLD
jgi:hypothetical protein